MFNISTDNPRINQGKLDKLILEFGEVPNADTQYHEGYLDKEDTFVSLGVNKVHLQDKDGGTKFTDLLTRLNTTQDVNNEVLTFLLEELPSCIQDEKETLDFEESVIEDILDEIPIAVEVSQEEKTETYLSLMDRIKAWLGIK